MTPEPEAKTKKLAELIISMSTDYLMDGITESTYTANLKMMAKTLESPTEQENTK